MKHRIRMISIFTLVTLAYLTTPGATNSFAGERDELACYRWTNFPNERTIINIRRHSALVPNDPTRKEEHADQVSYSVHGKDAGVCGGNTVAVSAGTVVTSEGNSFTHVPRGAHLGFEILSVRATGSVESCWPVQVDCSADENDPDPNDWTCTARNDAGSFFNTFHLIKVDIDSDPRCALFQDGVPELRDGAAPIGPGNKQAGTR